MIANIKNTIHYVKSIKSDKGQQLLLHLLIFLVAIINLENFIRSSSQNQWAGMRTLVGAKSKKQG